MVIIYKQYIYNIKVKLFHHAVSFHYFHNQARYYNVFTPISSISTFLTIPLKTTVFKRHMFSRFGNVTQQMPRTGITRTVRRMTICHAGNFVGKKPKLTDTDPTNHHKKVYQSKCSKPDCQKINCADIKNDGSCPGRTASENQQYIPPLNPKEGRITKIVGNLTSKVPLNKPGIRINKTRNYSGQNKPQEMVVESTPPIVDPKDIQVDAQSTGYVQEPAHHNTITTNTK